MTRSIFSGLLGVLCLVMTASATESPLDTGNRLFLEHDFEGALKQFESIMNSPLYFEQRGRALFMIGECYRQTGNMEMARRAYWKSATEFHGSDFADNAYLEMAKLAYHVGKEHLSESIVLFETIVSQYKNSDVEAEAWIGLARARARMHFFQGAEKALNNLITRFPSSTILGDAYYERGQLLSNPVNPNHDFGLAIEAYRKVAEQYPLSRHIIDACFALGNLYWEQGRIESAISFYRRVVMEAPDSFLAPLAQMNIALCYQDIKDYSAAINSFKQLLVKFPQPASVKTNIRKLIQKLKTKNSNRLNVSAWIAHVDPDTKIGEYSGDVRISLGNTRISADDSRVDIGNDRLSASGHVNLKWKNELTITADEMICRLSDRRCTLTGNVELQRMTGGQIHKETSDRMEFSLNDGTISGQNNEH